MKNFKKKKPEPDNFSEYWIDMLKNRESEEQYYERIANSKKLVKRLVKKLFK